MSLPRRAAEANGRYDAGDGYPRARWTNAASESRTLALSTPSGGEQMPPEAAASWLRQRATGRIRVISLQRHQHQALIMATTQGWQTLAPLATGQLGLTLRRYAAAGAQDPERGDWQIDVLEAL